MNMTQSESIDLVNGLLDCDLDNTRDIVLCTPFTSLSKVSELIKDSDISLGAQNVYYEDAGAYTGEISTAMLKDLDVKYVIIGHSERRKIFGESDELINKKLRKLLEENLTPILCVGETLEERKDDKHFDKVKNQIDLCLEGIKPDDIENIVIAYEPIWAIGTGESASSEDAEEMCKFIREHVGEKFGEKEAEKMRIQYGGSVKPDIVDELMEKENVDGALVGGASLKAKDFSRIINFEVNNG